MTRGVVLQAKDVVFEDLCDTQQELHRGVRHQKERKQSGRPVMAVQRQVQGAFRHRSALFAVLLASGFPSFFLWTKMNLMTFLNLQ